MCILQKKYENHVRKRKKSQCSVYNKDMATVQPAQNFLDDFIACAKQAKKRIYIQSMIFESGEVLSKLEPVLLQKAQEGVDIHITIDWIARRYVHDDLGILPVLNFKQRLYNNNVRKETAEIIESWSTKGIKFRITNIPHFLTSPITIFRRNHTKIFLIDDHAVWIGGLNLFDLAFGWIDFMVKFTDKETISAVSQQYHFVNSDRPKDNYRVACNKQTTLLVDAGRIGSSIIYNEAIKSVKKAKKSIFFVSQFLPDDVILDALIDRARHGVAVTVITSNEDYKIFSKFPYKFAYQLSLRRIKNSPIKLFYQHTKVHAKLLLIDDTIGMFGSHNFVNIGVILGTEEIAIKTEDSHLIKQLQTFVDKHTITI